MEWFRAQYGRALPRILSGAPLPERLKRLLTHHDLPSMEGEYAIQNFDAMGLPIP